MIEISLSLIVAVYVLLYLSWVKVIIPVFISPLSKIPSAHFTSSFSPLWILWKRYSEQENKTIHAAHAKYGNIVRLGPNEVSVDCVDGGIKTVYGGGFDKWNWYSNQFDNYGVPCMFSMVKSKAHAAQKRMVSNVYSKSYLQSSPHVHKISNAIIYDRLLPLLNNAAVKQEPIDVLQLHFASTMDFINAFIFGLGNGSDFIRDVKTRERWLAVYQSRRAFRFWDGEMPALKFLTAKLGFPVVPAWVNGATETIERWVLDRCEAASTWTESVSDSPRKEDTTPAIVYDQVANAMKQQEAASSSTSSSSPSASKSPSSPSHPLNLRIASELQDHLAAGHETSGITLTYLFWELSRHPALQASLRSELLTLSPPLKADPSPTLANPSAPSSSPSPEKDTPNPRTIDALPLLNACLTETLRLHAAIPGPQPRTTPFPPVSLAGKSPLLDPGTRVSAQPYSLHRNAAVFPDPDTWRPARWLDPGHNNNPADEREDGNDDGNGDGDAEKRKSEMARWFWAFGSGSRMCVGMHFALQEMKLITAAVYTNFTTHIVNDEGIEQVDAYTAGPKANRLILRFERVESSST